MDTHALTDTLRLAPLRRDSSFVDQFGTHVVLTIFISPSYSLLPLSLHSLQPARVSEGRQPKRDRGLDAIDAGGIDPRARADDMPAPPGTIRVCLGRALA